MAGNILTLTTIWNNFNILNQPSFETINEKKEGDVLYTQILIEGKEVQGQKIKIAGVLAKRKHVTAVPAILLLEDFSSGCDYNLIKSLVKRGYSVLSIDVAGQVEGKEHYTQYPDCVSFANYETAKQNLYSVKGAVTDTCWYEWACAVRYALKFLSDQPFVTKVGGIGLGESATVMWQVAGTDKNLDCAVFALNAGWKGYRGIYKFGGQIEPQFSDEMYKFIAGIDAQSYAMHVKCPTLILSATNSNDFDCDRAVDTATRMENAPYKAVHYSVGYRDRVNVQAFNCALTFLDKFLFVGGADKKVLPSEVDIRCEIIDKKIEVSVVPDSGEVKEVSLYVCEEICTPSERAWFKMSANKAKDGVYTFTYCPYPLSTNLSLFAQVEYKDGYAVGSAIINKKFNKDEVALKYKSKILYSSREKGLDSEFYPVSQGQENSSPINVSDKNKVKVKKGPMGIEGVACDGGLLCFKFKAQKDTPPERALLMFDVYVKDNGTFFVKLVSDFYGQKREYIASISLKGYETWQNVKFDLPKFKTVEGMVLKSYNNINAIEFNFDGGEFLINNALWV